MAFLLTTSIPERCLLLLELLAARRDGMSLGELAERAGMPKSATHRLLSSLVEAGFVAQTPSRDYRLTLKLITLAFRFLGKTGIAETCQEPLDRLAAETNELVRMTVVEAEGPVWVAKAQGATSSLLVDGVMGQPVVLHATATGKVWLASLPEDQALRHVLHEGFGDPTQHGPNVVTSVESLLAELNEVRRNDYATAWEEAEPGVVALAVPIRAAGQDTGPLVGTVSVAGPVHRLSRERLLGFLPRLRATADELAALGPLLAKWHGRGAARPQAGERKVS